MSTKVYKWTPTSRHRLSIRPTSNAYLRSARGAEQKGLPNTGGCVRDCAPSTNTVPFTMRALNRSPRLNYGGLGGPGDHCQTPEKDGHLPAFAWMLTSWWILKLEKKFREPICDCKRVVRNHKSVGSLDPSRLGDAKRPTLGRKEPSMLIIGWDYNPGFRQIANVDTESGATRSGSWKTSVTR